MRILVTGSGGMIGRKLVERLVADKTLGGKPIQSLTLVDVVESPIPEGAPKDTNPIAADFSEKGVAATLIQERPDVIFHLAAIVSGDAEANFEKGYHINFNGSWALFEASARSGKKTAQIIIRAAATNRASFLLRAWRCSAHPFPIRCRTPWRPHRLPATAPKRR